jgi:competence protein ComEA
LESLDGIGPVLAARIVAYRKVNGPFLTVEDLLKVSGIGTAKYGQFKEKLRV